MQVPKFLWASPAWSVPTMQVPKGAGGPLGIQPPHNAPFFRSIMEVIEESQNTLVTGEPIILYFD
jgi:hypothetical protein